MTKNIAKAEYDEEVDILYVHKDGNVKYSIDIDDTILDMGSRNRIIGVEVHNASKKFGIAIAEGLKLSMKKVLKSIRKAFLKASYGVNSFVVQIGFVAQVATKTVNEGLIIQAPIKKELLVAV